MSHEQSTSVEYTFVPDDLYGQILVKPSGELQTIVSQEIMSPDEIKNLRNRDEYTLDKTKHDIKVWLLWAVCVFLIVIGIAFVLASCVYLWWLFADSSWTDKHPQLTELLKYGWTIAGTVILTRFSGHVFQDPKPTSLPE